MYEIDCEFPQEYLKPEHS